MLSRDQPPPHDPAGDLPPRRGIDQLLAASIEVQRALRLIDPGAEPARHLRSALARLDDTVTAIHRAGLVWTITGGSWLKPPASDTLAALALGSMGRSDLPSYLRALARRGIELPHVQVATFVLSKASDRLTVTVPNDVIVWDLCHLQPSPTWDASHSGQPQTATNLPADGRWPVFTQRAIAAGYHTVHSVPMRLRDIVLGTLTLFSTTPGPMPALIENAARQLANLATIGVLLHHTAAIATISETERVPAPNES